MPSFSYLTLTFSIICLLLRVFDEFHFHLKWHQSKWTRVTQSLSCPGHFIMKSGRKELQGKTSRKQIQTKLFFNQSHPNGQKIHARKPKAYSKKTLTKKIKKVLTLSDNYYQLLLTLSLSYSQTILYIFLDIK